MLFKLCALLTVLLFSTISISKAREVNRYPTVPAPTDTSSSGWSSCGVLGNSDLETWWLTYSKGVVNEGNYATARDYYIKDLIYFKEAEDLIGAHYDRIFAGAYTSDFESADDFYSRCLNSPFRKLLDTLGQWPKH